MTKMFLCSKCGETFEVERDGWSAEAAEAEYAERFAEEKAAGEERAIICDDCYKIIMNQ